MKKNDKKRVEKHVFTFYTERRKFPRLKKTLDVGIRKLDSLEKYQDGVTANIGAGGFRIEVAFFDRPFIVNQIIEVTIKDPDNEENPLMAIGRIAWLKQKEGEHGYDAGIAFMYMKKEDRKRFNKFIEEEDIVKKETKK